MRVTVLNTQEELKSFPLTQSIQLKIDSQIEQSNLKDVITLIRNKSETGLFNMSNMYNQSMGYIKENFDAVDLKIDSKPNDSGSLLTITPVTPLSPGFVYTLIVNKNLTNPYITVTKPNSKSNSTVTFSTLNVSQASYSIEILSDPSITQTTNIIKISIQDNINGTKDTQTIDLKKKKDYTINGVYTISFPSMVYVKGEVFNVESKGVVNKEDDFFLNLTANITDYIKPISNENSSISTNDLLSKLVNQTSKPSPKPKASVKYINNNKILVTLEGITTDNLDFDRIVFNTDSAFNMYTLSNLGLYNPSKSYQIHVDIIDNLSFYVVVREK